MNRFDKPYRVLPTIDTKKMLELFTLAGNLDTHEMLQFSLMNKIPLDVEDDENNSLIHIVVSIDGRRASEHAKLNVIKFLFQNNVNPDKPNKYNKTPLHIACSMQLESIVSYLLEIGANPNYQDNMGNTPFHYLLTGYIKSMDLITEVVDFVPPPKKIAVDTTTTLLNIKSDLYNMMMTEVDPSNTRIKMIDQIPVFKTIQLTLDNLLGKDKEVTELKNKLLNTITELATKTEPSSLIPRIKEDVGIVKNAIKNKIMALFNNLPTLDNFQTSYNTDETSWAPDNINATVIKDGRVKKSIKKELTQTLNNIEKSANQFQPIDMERMDEMNNGFDDMINSYGELFKRRLRKENPNNRDTPIFLNGNFHNEPDFKKDFENINNMIRHKDAIDNASPIIDFTNLKFVGGPRVIVPYFETYDYTVNPINTFTDYLRAILQFRSDGNENKMILSLLLPSLPISIIDTFNNQADLYNILVQNPDQPNALIDVDANGELNFTNLYNVFNLIINDTTGDNLDQNNWMSSDGINRIDAGGVLLPDKQTILQRRLLYYLIFAFTAIKHPNNWDRLKNLQFTYNNGVNDVDANFFDFIERNPFAKKWYNLYDPTKIGAWLFNMWCDMMCGLEPSNLNCSISYQLLLLITGIHNSRENITKGIINAFKPHIIAEIIRLPHTPESCISMAIMTLLNNDIDDGYLGTIMTQLNAIGDIDNNVPIKDPRQIEIKNIGKLVFQYIIDLSNNTNNVSKMPYFIANHIDNRKPIDTISRIIMKYYEKMPIKPIKMTIINFIYYLRNYKNPNKNIFLDISVPYQPNITDNNDKIAQAMGLNYEGTLIPYEIPDVSDIKTSLNVLFSLTPGGRGAFGPGTRHVINHNARNHNVLSDSQIPFPLNFIKAVTTPYLDQYLMEFYHIENNRSYRPPTYHCYYRFLLVKINEHQTRLKEILNVMTNRIQSMLSGSTKEVKDLFTTDYIEAITITRHINYFTQQLITTKLSLTSNLLGNNIKITNLGTNIANYAIDSLAGYLNRINQLYFIYHYIFSPSNLIKLSRFNYYQLPTSDQIAKYLYYADTNNEVESIINNDDINSVNDPKSLPIDVMEGVIQGISLGNYDNLVKEYIDGFMTTNYIIDSSSYVQDKKSSLPPSLYNNLPDFYKYSVVELVKKLVTILYNNKNSNNSIYKKAMDHIEKIMITIDNKDIPTLNLLCKLLEEIIKEYVELYIENSVISYYNQFIANPTNKSALPAELTFQPKTFKINFTNVDIGKISSKRQFMNLYQPIQKLKKEDIYVLYPNDLANMTRLKLKYGLRINKKIIPIMLQSNASPFIRNLENLSAVYPIIKNYNHDIIREMKGGNNGVDFRDFENETPIKFILTELVNNMNKILAGYNDKKKLGDILGNIDSNLYGDVKSKIISNELFGKNILANLPESFHVVSYITLQFLAEYLFNSSDSYNIVDASELINMIEFDIDDIGKNYLGENFSKYEVPVSINRLVAIEMYNDKKKEFDEVNKNIINMKANIDKLKSENNTKLADKLEKSDNYKTLVKTHQSLMNELNRLVKFSKSSNLPNMQVDGNHPIVQRYNRLYLTKKIPNILTMYAWGQMFNQPIPKDNYNLIMLFLLKRQQDIITNFNATKMDELTKIKKAMEHIAKMCEDYFETKKFTDNNMILKFMESLLIYVCRIVIGSGLEMMIRRILHTYYSAQKPSSDFTEINNSVNYFMTSKDFGYDESFVDMIYSKVCPSLVKNSAEIFANKEEEQGHYIQQVREILGDYFNNFENTPLAKSPEILGIFKKDVTTYFDTFVSRTISLWHVNIENIFKFYINNYRCLETLETLINR
jgi:hypothetical protein